MSWIYLYFPNLQLDRCHKDTKDLTPFAIIDDNLNEVVQLNHLAHLSGIRKKMGLASSITLSSELKVATYEYTKENKELHKIAESLYFVVSDIFLDPPQGIYLNIRPLLKLYKNQQDLWKAIVKRLESYEVRYHFASSYSALSAKLLANAMVDQLIENKSEAIPLLTQLPIQALNLSKVIESKLIRIGIKHIKQLFSVPLKDLAIRFDLPLINCIGYLKGELKQPLSPFSPTVTFFKQHELSFEISNSLHLEKPINKLLLQLEQFLIQSNLTTQNIKLSFITSNKDLLHMSVNSAVFQTSTNKWMALIRLKLEKFKLREPIRELRLEVFQLHKQNFNTLDMLTTKESYIEKAELISILQAKLGRDAISQLSYKPEYLPEKSTLRTSTVYKNNKIELTQQATVATRPALLLNNPISLTEKIELKSLPERIQSDWWSDYPIIRDYFVARNTLQQWYWVFRCPNKSWYIHGYFG